jgi:hypothetical protein
VRKVEKRKMRMKKYKVCQVVKHYKKFHHPKANLAKFGYIISIYKGKKKTQNPSLFLATSGNHHKTLAIWNF